MSDNPQYEASSDAHVGPIKSPKQLLLAVFVSFIAPIFIIFGLVAFVVSGVKPSGAAKGDDMSLSGVSAATSERDLQARLMKIGSIEIRDGNRPLALGDVVFKAQCAACHATGAAGAPKFEDAAAWGPRIGQGYATLLDHALHGKGAMPAQGGGDYEDAEIGRAVVYMANSGGAKFPVPERPAAAGAAAADGAASGAAPAASGAAAPAAMEAASAAVASPPVAAASSK